MNSALRFVCRCAVPALAWLCTPPAALAVLELGDPSYCTCGWVAVNGYVENARFGMVWDWGDGQRSYSMFPASHRYAANGTYTITATAVDCTNEVAVTTAHVATATGPGCPTDAEPECFAYPCRYVYPSSLHLVAGATSDLPLELQDTSGSPTGEDATFTPDVPSLVEILPSRLVHALRGEGQGEIGTWVHAGAEGVEFANSCVVRVLPADPGVIFFDATGEHTVLRYPDSARGENIGALVQRFQVPTVNEYAYAIERGMIGTSPFRGCRQIFEVDFGATEESRVCGISGNPIRLGWNIEGNEWQNCFLVPFLAPRSPQWGVFYHELGHNVTWASPSFGPALGTTDYSEGLATAMGLSVMDELLRRQPAYPIGEDARASMQYVFDRDAGGFDTSFRDWLSRGADFAALDANVVDGIWLHHAGADIGRFARRFFFPLGEGRIDALGSVLCGIETEADRHTFFAALVSAAAGTDLSSTFAGTYHYPLNRPLFDLAYGRLADALDASASGRVPDGRGGTTPLTVSRAVGGDLTLAWGPSCNAADTDYAVYEGTLGVYYSHGSHTCSTGGARTSTFAPAPGSTYYLVVPRSTAREGSYGTSSSGIERPPGADACAVQLVATCP